MKAYNWNPSKNQTLIDERDVSFESVIFHLQNNDLIDDIKHPNDKEYPNQRVYIVDIDGYAYLVPYVESDDEVFLKTIIPSRKATRKYLGESK
ncbi:BrnT family toxin [Candidatus Thiosymbion oneisti]|uniref:BrnT family toxin n=1 Tax=Candidatus Thiosymbion oneisti TaxID=589554 RepID=UPI000AA5813E|nr:BrnT family toxin [Candidatus Thiosymbion oneisti]